MTGGVVALTASRFPEEVPAVDLGVLEEMVALSWKRSFETYPEG